MSNNVIDETQGKKAGVKTQKPEGEIAPDETNRAANPLEDLLSQAQSAYTTYLGAQRKIAVAYKQREEEEIRAYKDNERKAQAAYEETVEKALKVRAGSEGNARRAYDEAMEKAAQAYEGEIARALKTYRETTTQQWQDSRELIEQVWRIYQGNGTK